MPEPVKKVDFTGVIMFPELIDQLPKDIYLDLKEIRKWAFKKGLISDPEFQLISEPRIKNLTGYFGPNDNLQIVLTIHPGDNKPLYMEYPYLPVKSLILRGDVVEIYYWRIFPSVTDSSGKVTSYGSARFGFVTPGCYEEICSETSSKAIVEKLHLKLLELQGKYKTEGFSDGSREITAEGVIAAQFVKIGRSFDVTLEPIRNRA